MLLLHSTGARSGQERVNPVAYQTLEDDSVAIFASKGGAPTNPDWYHNLVANPDTTVEMGDDTYAVRARVAARRGARPALEQAEGGRSGIRGLRDQDGASDPGRHLGEGVLNLFEAGSEQRRVDHPRFGPYVATVQDLLGELVVLVVVVVPQVVEVARRRAGGLPGRSCRPARRPRRPGRCPRPPASWPARRPHSWRRARHRCRRCGPGSPACARGAPASATCRRRSSGPACGWNARRSADGRTSTSPNSA